MAGVAAHELGHIAHDHSTRAVYRSFAVALVVGVLLGDLSGGTVAGGLAEWTLNSGYSRDAEREADAFALERLQAAGIGSGGLLDFFARLAEKDKTVPLSASSPPTRRAPNDWRISAVRNADRQARPDGRRTG